MRDRVRGGDRQGAKPVGAAFDQVYIERFVVTAVQLAHLLGLAVVDAGGPVGVHGVRDRLQYKLDAIWGVVAVQVCELVVEAVVVNESVCLAGARDKEMDPEVDVDCVSGPNCCSVVQDVVCVSLFGTASCHLSQGVGNGQGKRYESPRELHGEEDLRNECSIKECVEESYLVSDLTEDGKIRIRHTRCLL